MTHPATDAHPSLLSLTDQCGGNESCQPFATFIEDGCNGWRNYADIQCNWG